ncbi:MAG: N-acetylmuramoyl-L-alanine amidase [Gammaproteobacteria bacterium]|nr:N-acetylmuramoyl-L-alanine amidase [Gammaproteobacteria bacterium]
MHKHRRRFISQLAGLTTLAAAPLAQAAATGVRVNNIRLSKNEGDTRLVFDLDASVRHKLFSLHNPERVVIDLERTRLMNSGALEDMHNNLLRGIRTGVRNEKDLRIVLDLNAKASPRSFVLQPSEGQGHRLVIDLHDPKAKVVKNQPKLRDVVVAIDAGHGGNDPGATGRLGTHEKDITLQIARKLQAMINKQPGMQPAMIRNSDRFMRLRDRIKRAHQVNADLMISIHADSFPDKRARGASVYALSVSGATSESAHLLAENENKVDMLFGNVNLDDKDEMVKQVLLDLSLTGTIQSSLDIGSEVLHELTRVGQVHKKKVQQAGFAVLKAPNIPAVLLETAFISNPNEERKLRSPSHQSKLAKAILRGVSDYFARKAPPGTWLAQNDKTYTIQRGDTLADISEKFNTPVSHIRSRNAIHSDRLRIGQTLIIPIS